MKETYITSWMSGAAIAHRSDAWPGSGSASPPRWPPSHAGAACRLSSSNIPISNTSRAGGCSNRWDPSAVKPDTTMCEKDNPLLSGNVTSASENGHSVTVGTDSSTNYSAPTSITTNVTTNYTWSTFLGLNSQTGAN